MIKRVQNPPSVRPGTSRKCFNRSGGLPGSVRSHTPRPPPGGDLSDGRLPSSWFLWPSRESAEKEQDKKEQRQEVMEQKETDEDGLRADPVLVQGGESTAWERPTPGFVVADHCSCRGPLLLFRRRRRR